MEPAIKKERKINKKKLILTIITILLILSTIIAITTYCLNSEFRKWVDIIILQKQINQGDTTSIEINSENMGNVYAFDKYIAILENKNLKIFNTAGEEETAITTDIKNPIFNSKGKYLAIAEKDGESIYLIENNKVVWNTNIEGKISDIEINENGYVGVIISDISYKNIITIFNTEGKSLLKTYVATNKVVDISISQNNQFLAIAEVDISGVLVQSSIRIIDIIKAKTDANNSIKNIYTAEVDKLITNIEYQNKERLLCMYNNSVNIIEDDTDKELLKIGENNITFASVKLGNGIISIEEKKQEKYVSSLNIINTINNKAKTYNMEEIAKEIHTCKKVIALNLGTELHIINTNGWLMKKYVSEQEINKVIVSDKIVGIIYRDKIEIIKL